MSAPIGVVDNAALGTAFTGAGRHGLGGGTVTRGQVRFAAELQRERSRQRGHNKGTSLREDAGYDEKCVEMRKRRSEALPKTCRRAEDALPYSTLD